MQQTGDSQERMLQNPLYEAAKSLLELCQNTAMLRHDVGARRYRAMDGA